MTQAMGRIVEMLLHVGKILCKMDFMVVDTNGYDVLLGVDCFIKSGAVVDVEQNLM
jgi:hypothetical protein